MDEQSENIKHYQNQIFLEKMMEKGHRLALYLQ